MVEDVVEDSESTGMPAQAARRVILLGASNVTLGLSTVMATARQAWGQPLDISLTAWSSPAYPWRV